VLTKAGRPAAKIFIMYEHSSYGKVKAGKRPRRSRGLSLALALLGESATCKLHATHAHRDGSLSSELDACLILVRLNSSTPAMD
jgi:hypothetical protein